MGSEENLPENRARSATCHVFLCAAELADAHGDSTAARRLSHATIHWLKHAFEIHAIHSSAPKNWCWHLLGACWLGTSVTVAYLPTRMPISVATCREGFGDLCGLWQQGSD
jgi:hypothetical protein